MTASLFPTGPLGRSTSMPTASRKPVRRSEGVFRNLGVLEPQIFGARIAEFLRTIHPQKTATCIEAETQISAKTVEKWLSGNSSPSGNTYHRLIEVYGPELFVFVNPDASPASLQEAARVCRQARLERQAAKIRQQLVELWGGR
jgi:DNA-binding phage protein